VGPDCARRAEVFKYKILLKILKFTIPEMRVGQMKYNLSTEVKMEFYTYQIPLKLLYVRNLIKIMIFVTSTLPSKLERSFSSLTLSKQKVELLTNQRSEEHTVLGWVDIGTRTIVPLKFVAYLSKITKIKEKSVLTQ
jgi:hypothetical protein